MVSGWEKPLGMVLTGRDKVTSPWQVTGGFVSISPLLPGTSLVHSEPFLVTGPLLETSWLIINLDFWEAV